MKPAGYIAVVLALVAASFIAGKCVSDHLAERNTPEVVRDTVMKLVTVYKDFPKPMTSVSAGMIPVPKYMLYPDSIKVEIPVPVPGKTDTVYLPREQQYYEEEDGKLRLWISGYQPRVDRYEVDWTTTEITETYRPKPKRWGIGLTASYGVTLVDGKVVVAPFIGGGFTFNIVQW